MNDTSASPGIADVYNLSGYSNSKVFGDFVKRLLLIMVNSEDRDSARKALHSAVHKDKSLQLPKEIKSTKAEHLHPVMDAFQRKHQPIGHYFCTGVGIDLQYPASQEVMSRSYRVGPRIW